MYSSRALQRHSAAHKAGVPEKSVLVPKDVRHPAPCQYLSQFHGRHNGGLPCFTQERSAHRAAKVKVVCPCWLSS
ncbi:hypothetical protein ACOMHN_057842 [Nucella lapillus]